MGELGGSIVCMFDRGDHLINIFPILKPCPLFQLVNIFRTEENSNAIIFIGLCPADWNMLRAMGRFLMVSSPYYSVRSCYYRYERNGSPYGWGRGREGIRCVIFKPEASSLPALWLDMRHIQYQGETLPPLPLVLAFHLVLGKFLT